MSTEYEASDKFEWQDTAPVPEPHPGPTPRQPVSVPHLVMGLVFLGIAGSWALHAAGVIESVEVQWLLPAILVLAGAAGLVASLTRTGKGFARDSSRT